MASLYDQWDEMINNLPDDEKEAFGNQYYDLEQAVYEAILQEPESTISGTFEELAERFGFDQVWFAGFMDGINESLKKSYDLKKLKPKSAISLDVDFEKLYFNMLDAGATWLSSLQQWDGVLSAERRKEIAKERKRGMQATSTKIDRNAPCPCGSGKKYKKCCGAIA